MRFRGFFRTLYFLPVVTSLLIAGLIFSLLFSTSFGLVNRILEPLGIAPINWLADPNWMKVTLILALLWRWTGNDMVLMLAGLQQIPPTSTRRRRSTAPPRCRCSGRSRCR